MTNNPKLIEEIAKCMKTLDRIIDMHSIHIRKPTTATPASQNEMMELLSETKNCIIRQLGSFPKTK